MELPFEDSFRGSLPLKTIFMTFYEKKGLKNFIPTGLKTPRQAG